MTDGDPAIDALREALRHSPEDIPLRRRLAEGLLRLGRAAEAERAFRDALALAPRDPALKAGLADAYSHQAKRSHALVVLDDLLKLAEPPARGLALHARLLEADGEVERAVALYRRAVAADPGVADAAFAGRLGLPARPGRDDEDDDPGDDAVEGRVRAPGQGGAEGPGVAVERPGLTFADVAGMEALKEEIRIRIVHPLAHPEVYRAYGQPVGGGLLLYGPPRCGKTHLARAAAGECRAGFLAVGIDDVLEMWLGRGERQLHDLFRRARAHAPCVLFFDGVDALAARRSDSRGGGGRPLVNQFLAETDGVGARNDGVLILAATDAPWHVDPACRRPGRSGRVLFVPPPDAPARAAILGLHLRGKPQRGVNPAALARTTEGFSGADLKAVVDRAVEAKLREAIRTGTPAPLTTRDLLAAAAGVRPSTREWFAAARNHALYANQDGVYDDVLRYLKM